MDEHTLRTTLINPFYAITIHSDLLGEHEHLVSKEHGWRPTPVSSKNSALKPGWPELLATLEGSFPRTED